jgi:hypothetical protein
MQNSVQGFSTYQVWFMEFISCKIEENEDCVTDQTEMNEYFSKFFFEIAYKTQVADFSKFNEKPVKTVIEFA